MSKVIHKPKVLILSVGSLVGQNIIDSLEYKNFERRHLVHIIGTNSEAISTNNFRCDECFLVPATSSPDFADKLREILRKVSPDIILCARDADTSVIWKILNEDPSLAGKLPYGSHESILIALDKFTTHLFCVNHGLPFADTFSFLKSGGETELIAFAEKVGFPMVAKPSQGFASKGVFFVRNLDELRSMSQYEGYLVQEYLGIGSELDSYFQQLSGPIPLFTEVPNVNHHTCHVPISSDGQIGEIFVLKNHHSFGAVTRLQRVEHPELENLAGFFANAFIQEGGFGPLSIQFRMDAKGKYKAQELNLRTTGSTFPRLIMGQDEIGFIFRDLLPEVNFPIYKKQKPDYNTIIFKSLYSFSLLNDQITTLKGDGYWHT